MCFFFALSYCKLHLFARSSGSLRVHKHVENFNFRFLSQYQHPSGYGLSAPFEADFFFSFDYKFGIASSILLWHGIH